MLDQTMGVREGLVLCNWDFKNWEFLSQILSCDTIGINTSKLEERLPKLMYFIISQFFILLLFFFSTQKKIFFANN